ncbi:lysozyme inhibitor LprI family protein [Sulfurirhabdus autotrophica]|uniref:Uncharacterized protein YecT (DUF1311 family) n=1 Tax=Sulfurirhabdus autotrophica TaxID=1706046 RepID=A0A4R3YHE7_9PROT|nr:lysozyme inhibitor LprI family protein [Sulfurirhabdus autotrophica]TCV90688.1 uncharacterized protein YecT (DUF1311 family) [Sulfurirhabdus autotrophica]
MRKIGLALTLTLLSAGAHAAGCATPKTAFDQVYCAGNLFSQVDHDLNVAYGKLKTHLNPATKDTLKRGQLSWIKERNDQCSKEDSTGFFVNLDCANTMTTDRLSFLKERERECTSTGCVESKIGGR